MDNHPAPGSNIHAIKEQKPKKDWIKLREGWPADLPVAVARLEVRWTGARALPDLVGERCDACRESAAD